MEVFMKFLFIYIFLAFDRVSAEIFELNKTTSFPFVAAILNRSNSQLISTAVVISPFWILTVAHLLPSDCYGLNASEFLVMAGAPLTLQQPALVLTHPLFSYGCYTAEDIALFHMPTRINVESTVVNHGRFPYFPSIKCDIFYLDDEVKSTKTPHSYELSIRTVEIMKLRECLHRKLQSTNEIAKFYNRSLLCSIAERGALPIGEKSGFVMCENRLTGLLITKKWQPLTVANFTDVGVYGNWLQSRVSGVQFYLVKDNRSNSTRVTQISIYFIAFTYFLLIQLI